MRTAVALLVVVCAQRASGEEACAADFPSVDISPFLVPDDSPLASARDATAAAWDHAMREWGFARVTGDGVPPDAFAPFRAAALDFFDEPLERKRAYSDPSGRYGPEGYTSLGVESVGRTSAGALGGEGAGAQPDLVENVALRGRPPASIDDLASRPRFPPTLFPSAGEHWAAMDMLHGAILRMTARALGVPDELFEGAYRGTQANALRLAHYPAVPGGVDSLPAGQARYGAHTDYQGYTLLMQDPTVGGLEVFRAPNATAGRMAGEWVAVPPGGLVVNAGDLIELWVNGRWRSAMHRVTNSAITQRRLSIAFFTGPRHDALVEPLLQPGEARRFDAVIAGEHLQRKLAMSNV